MILLALAFAAAVAAAPTFPVNVHIPIGPKAFVSSGQTNIVYELQLQNFRNGEIEWDRLDVLANGTVVAGFSAADLESMLTRPGQAGAANVRRLAAGTTAVAFLWLRTGETPGALSHRLVFTLPNATSGERVVETPAVAVDATPIVLGPPARGGRWVARWNDGTSFHRRGLMSFDGEATIPQRFAIDWNRFGDDGREWHGEGTKNSDYAVYGQEVIAVADGVVEHIADGIPENEPGSLNPTVPMSVATAAGNCVQLKLRDGVYALYAHLQPHSLRVREGQRVQRGQLLGLVGNSGNATGPHLHFHLSTLPGLRGEGLPYVIDRFDFLGTEPPKADSGMWSGTAEAQPRRREWPDAHSVLSFAK